MRFISFLALAGFQAFLGVALCIPAEGQSRSNATGNGGMHEIRGRVYLPSGKTLDTPVEVDLESTNFPSSSVYTDRSGSYSFKGLSPGNYTVVVNSTDAFETTREYVMIDTEAQGSGTIRIMPTPKVITVPIYLQQKRGDIQKTGVINAKWSAVPHNAIERYRKGLELAGENKLPEAAAEFRRSIEASMTFAPAHTALGKVLLRSGKLDEAVTSFKSALTYDPNDFDAHLDLGITLLNRKQYVEAEPELVTAAYINRTAVTPHYYLGILFVMRDDLDVARKAFETAKELKGDKSLPALHKYLGRIYMSKSLKKEALAELETYIKLVPDAQDIEKVKKDINDLKAGSN